MRLVQWGGFEIEWGAREVGGSTLNRMTESATASEVRRLHMTRNIWKVGQKSHVIGPPSPSTGGESTNTNAPRGEGSRGEEMEGWSRIHHNQTLACLSLSRKQPASCPLWFCGECRVKCGSGWCGSRGRPFSLTEFVMYSSLLGPHGRVMIRSYSIRLSVGPRPATIP